MDGMKQHIPNILTIARIVLCFVTFVALALLTAGTKGIAVGFAAQTLMLTAFVSFAVAAVTDFFDGYLARKWQVVSTMGAILDPIADKILVTGAILGLLGLQSLFFILASGLILFREFAVSAMREVLAPRGIKLPVTFLAKTKTTLQLIALAGIMFFALWQFSEDPPRWSYYGEVVSQLLYIIAALVTVWTGVEYALSASKALKA
jgi:CDP-diacylglycerol--glycerol-3-phosphate 3-phosphatidyltransferase